MSESKFLKSFLHKCPKECPRCHHKPYLITFKKDCGTSYLTTYFQFDIHLCIFSQSDPPPPLTPPYNIFRPSLNACFDGPPYGGPPPPYFTFVADHSPTSLFFGFHSTPLSGSQCSGFSSTKGQTEYFAVEVYLFSTTIQMDR